MMGLVFFFVLANCSRETEFDSERWKSGNKKVRGEMVLDLIHKPILQGKAKSQIADMLGKPDQNENSSWAYFVDDGGLFGVNFGSPYLLVRFDSVSNKCDLVSTSD